MASYRHTNIWYVYNNEYNIKQNLPRASPSKSNSLYNSYDNLKQKYEEEHHEVEWGITPEGLVNWSVPAYEAERC